VLACVYSIVKVEITLCKCDIGSVTTRVYGCRRHKWILEYLSKNSEFDKSPILPVRPITCIVIVF
jgi:hypothetical protein